MLTSNNENIKKLILLIKDGNHSAFKEFFYLLQPELFNFLYKFLMNYNAAQDITQDAFIKFWDVRERIEPNDHPKSYIFKIARNLALNYISRTKESLSLENTELYEINTSNDLLQYNLLVNDLNKALLKLPERCREIFILCKYHNFKYQEIADILDISLQTVKNQMNKSLAILRKELKSHLE